MSVEDQNINTEEQVEVEQPEEEVVAETEEAEELQEAAEAETSSDTGAAEKNWQAEAEKLAEQIATYKDQAVRAQAEMQNLRRRAEMDVEKAHKFALEKFAKELLPVIDSLEKAIEADIAQSETGGALREGVEMTLSMFLSGIKKFNLEPIDAVGQPFDPALHEAMSMVPTAEAEPNTVIAAMQKGYTLSGRLIRPAMVMVAKQP